VTPPTCSAPPRRTGAGLELCKRSSLVGLALRLQIAERLCLALWRSLPGYMHALHSITMAGARATTRRRRRVFCTLCTFLIAVCASSNFRLCMLIESYTVSHAYR
jgi:hypothetical protein